MPANSSVAVANMALHFLGARPIVAFDEGTKFATLVSSIFDSERDATLRAYPWNFATKRVALVHLANAPASDWAAAFQLPADELRVLSTYPRMAFEIEGRTLVCDETAVTIKYTARIESPAAWDSLFKIALAAKLAMRMSYAATEQMGVMDRASAAYSAAIADARTADAQEGSVQSALAPEANVLVDTRNSRFTLEQAPFATDDFGLLGS